jgi:hypothetical protein
VGCPIRREAIAFQPSAARMRYFSRHLYMAQLYRMLDLPDRWLVLQLQAFSSLRLRSFALFCSRAAERKNIRTHGA